MKTILRIVTPLLFLIICSPGNAAKPSPVGTPPQGHTKLWQQVDSLANMGQPRSALEIVDKIYTLAKAGKDDPQVVKAVIYKIRLNADFEENFLQKSIAVLKKEISIAGQPSKQILQSVLAELYWKYFQNNEYLYRDRTRIAGNQPDSIETWDLTTLYNAITRTYLLSLENVDTLKNIPVGNFKTILDIETFGEKKKEQEVTLAAKFKPTLYDFLAGRALDFFTSGESAKILPAQRFKVDQTWYLGSTMNFIRNRMMIPADTASPASFALRIFRDLAMFHAQDKDRAALIDAELKRLEFVNSEAVFASHDSLYEEALKNFGQAEINSSWSTSISYTLAMFLNGQGERYQPLVSDRYKWRVKEAVEVCSKAISRFPDSEGAKNCTILKKSMQAPFLQITAENAVPVGKPSLALVNYKNIKELNFRLIKTDPGQYAEKSGSINQDEMIRYLAGLKALKSWVVIAPNDGDMQQHAFETRIPEAPSGFYILLVSTSASFSGKDETFSYTAFWSTQISYINRHMQDGNLAYYMLDRVTGVPLKNVKAEVWTKNYSPRDRNYTETKLYDLISDEQGYLAVPAAEQNNRNYNIYLKISYKDDYFITANFLHFPTFRSPERVSLQTMIYTDRAIYRPGQTIWFKAIILENTGEKSKLKTNFPTKLIFYDVNGRQISEQSLTTNDFGSVNGSFTAPTDLLPGLMTISNESGSTQVSVESYKIPTFEATIQPLDGNYKLGEKMVVTGMAKAYAGNFITGATVNYRVVRSARFPFYDRFWYWPMPSSPEIEVTNGTCTTDAAGKFTISFMAIPDQSVEKESNPVYDFTIYADVSDLNGETQSVEQTVAIGYTAMLLGINIPEMVNQGSDSLFKISSTNLNGRSTPALVGLALSLLRQPDRPYKPRQWERPDRNMMSRDEFHASFPYDIYGDENNPATWPVAATIFEKNINTKTDSILDLSKNPSLAPGSYLLTLKSTDPFGQPVEVKKFFTVFSAKSKEVPENTFSWFVSLKKSAEPGEKAQFLVGTKEDNVNLLYEITQRDSLISRQWLKLSDRAMVVEIPVTENLRGSFGVNFVFIKQNRVFQHTEVVNVPYKSRKLDIRFETFRDKLEPGAKESWKIRINSPAGKPAKAEFMAGMYDAALDVFTENRWNFSIYQRFSGSSPWSDDNAFSTARGFSRLPNPENDSYFFHPSLQLNWFGFNYFGGNVRHRSQAKGGPEVFMAMDVMSGNGNSEVPPPPPLLEAVEIAEMTGTTPKPAITPAMQVRRDFRETAFFYPSLVTDSTGSLLVQFTMPESLTRWKMLGLAHTQNLNYGLVEKELITQKELMVFPNAPRFVRQGDTVIFSARIVNLTNHDLSGEITLDLSDALTLRSFNTLMDTAGNPGSKLRIQPFSMTKGQNSAVSWKFIIPLSSDLSVLRYRVIARSGAFSDGEEKAIPVLTNRMLVTETLPLPVRGKGTTTFTFDKLLKSGQSSDKNQTLKNHRLTLEFATNPAWYAIQALPSMNDAPFETADAIFSAWWSNSVAAFIANSNPRIKSVFEAWKTLSPDALKSNLAKNEELKSALLDQTPWVLDASSETERKRNLGIYFDQNRVEENLRTNLAKLIRLQSPNGGWSWMKGMHENRYTTQAILTGIGKLHHLGIKNINEDPDVRNMVANAIRYLDEQIARDYNETKKYDPDFQKNNHLSSVQIQYLYALSFFTGPEYGKQYLPSVSAPAFTYYRAQAEKFWLKQDRYMQGMIALALSRLNSREIPALIMKSLGEKALHSGEMGMYWASEQGFYWYQAPIETQALMIEAFDEVSRDDKSVEEMKIWLLKQKQTQSWKSSRSTLDACYALLLRGADLLDPGPSGNSGNITITLGGEKIDSDKLMDVKKEAGTGYFQVSWRGSEIKPDMGKVTVSKSGQGVAWGALYWQYFENLDKITPAKTPVKLEKKLYAERNSASGPVLEEIPSTKPDQQLKAGDKLVVRITLSVDRDMEFVHMKDMRASGLEPINGGGLSGYQYQDGLGYYQSTTDVATNFFFDYLPKGTYVFEYSLKVNAGGTYSNGITTIQCMYAPEFSAHSEGVRIGIAY